MFVNDWFLSPGADSHVGNRPLWQRVAGKYSREFFNRKGELRKIDSIRPWPISAVLMEKYRWREDAAASFEAFLLPMLDYFPVRRATAREMMKVIPVPFPLVVRCGTETRHC